jgi:hypothetical protein
MLKRAGLVVLVGLVAVSMLGMAVPGATGGVICKNKRGEIVPCGITVTVEGGGGSTPVPGQKPAAGSSATKCTLGATEMPCTDPKWGYWSQDSQC